MLTDTLVNNFSCWKKIIVIRKRYKKKIKLTSVQHILKYIQSYRRCKLCAMKKKEKQCNMMYITCDVVLCKYCYGPYHKIE